MEKVRYFSFFPHCVMVISRNFSILGIILPDYWFVVTESRANSIYEFFHNISKDFRRYGVLDVEAIERWVAEQFVHKTFLPVLSDSLSVLSDSLSCDGLSCDCLSCANLS